MRRGPGIKISNVFVAIFPAAAYSLLFMSYCCGHWTTGVVIELLCGHWTDCLFWTVHTKHKKRKNSLRAKVQNVRRLTFEEIARDMQCRKPSSKENIVRSCSWWFLFKLRWVRHICNLISNSVWKENCWYRSKESPEIVIISNMRRRYRVERLLKYGQETEQLIFEFETARKVGSSGLVR